MHPVVRFAAVTAAVLACAAASAGGAAATGRRAPAPLRTPTARQTVLTLPTAGRVLVSQGPGGAYAVTLAVPPGRRRATALTTVRLGRQDYAIPWAALPYLGHGLALSLFDIGALEHAEHDGRIPITLRYHGRTPAVPGITVTRAGAGTAAGYLTPGSAARLGTALASRPGVSVALAGAGRQSRPVPAARTVTVTLKGTTESGRPDNGDLVLLGDVGNSNAAGTGLAEFRGGAARFRCPPGIYWAVALFAQVSANQQLTGMRMVVLPQFTVTGNTTKQVRAAAATSKVTLATPRPAVVRSAGLTVVRAAPHAPHSLLSSRVSSLGETMPGAPLWVSPVASRPSYGTLRAFTEGQLTSPAGRGVPYAYTLNFADPPGTIAPQHFTATGASLATIAERYFQDVRTLGAWESLGGTPYQVDTSLIGNLALPLRLPGRLVQYLSATPSTLWQSEYFEYQTIRTGWTPGGQASAVRLLHGGQHLAQNWNEYPLHPGVGVSLPGTGEVALHPSAVREGNMLSLDVRPFSDSQLGHIGTGFLVPFPGGHNQVRGSYAVYQNGKRIAHGNPVATNGLVSAELRARPSVITFALSATRVSPQYRLSASSTDVWTWHSRPAPGARVPAPWVCPDGVSRRCAVQPMITLDYDVARLGLTGAAAAGPQAITVTAGHIQLAASPAITRALAQVSLNDGKSWQRARVRTAGGGRFRVTFTAPRSAQVSPRITAADATGNTLTETILRAYRTLT
jgi:hypothetical protein